MAYRHLSCPRQAAGFTLVELIVILVLAGILAIVAMPRFADRVFDERGLRDTAKAALQHARHVAIAARRYVCVTTSAGSGAAGSLTLSIDTALPENGTLPVVCASALPLPTPGKSCAPVQANRLCPPTGVALGGDSVIFDPRGSPVTANKTPAAALSLSINADPTLTIVITPETGWIQ